MTLPGGRARSILGALALCMGFASQAAAEAASAAPPPRIAMLWSSAPGAGSRIDRWARYRVIVVSPGELGFEWEQQPHKDMATRLRPESIPRGRATLAKLRKQNPDALVLCELYYFEANTSAYPADSPWWFRDKSGRRQEFWKGCRNMAVDNPEYIEHVAQRIDAVVAAGEGRVGVFLDNLRYDPASKQGWNALLARVRSTCSDAPILVNAGWDSEGLDWIAPQINGVLYEDSIAHTQDNDAEAFYARIQRQGRLCREPRVGVNEVFGHRDDPLAARRELIRTLVYTDLCYLFADSTYGHKHDWQAEWGAPLGEPLAPPPTPKPGVLARRAFAGGEVLWLPADAPRSATISLAGPRYAVGQQQPARQLLLNPGEGALLLAEPFVPAAASP
ncbi:hypothetical protein Pla175_44070 [Pirellulimonas nuda]|uniref:Glycoside-hydrolase family GH114 TIM-barrel domain-containing protein n=1 Tax=Pirellulimonas nuda TaxID=2528009 RepID=A0A518DHV9_9BACT|nr:hypothetical protein [Pirellulimonas nuda]QDU90992.1 hypothetical protein Pla175_44070 [Pirellulimonas nuda]